MAVKVFDRWLAAAQAQLRAARAVDAAAMTAATRARHEAQVEVSRVQFAALSSWDREHATRTARAIRAVDLRTRACAVNVMAVIERVLPDAGPRTYGRRGQPSGV